VPPSPGTLPLTPLASLARWRPVRNLDAGMLLESFLVTGIAAILLIRAFLHATGYPKLYTHQLLAVGGLVVDGLVLLALDYMIREAERSAGGVPG